MRQRVVLLKLLPFLFQLFSDYLETSNRLSDDDGKAEACQALANAYHT